MTAGTREAVQRRLEENRSKVAPETAMEPAQDPRYQRATDASWVRHSFMVPSHDFGNVLGNEDHIFTSARLKFTDTTPGGNLAINPPPQFTRTADTRVKGKYAASRGMGRKYSELIDDNSQHVHLRFGVPQYNSMQTFINNSFNYEMATLSRTGRAPGFLYDLGRAIGFVVTLPIQPLLFIGKIYDFLSNKQTSKYYFLKPTMPLYWSTVNTMVNNLAVNMGIIPRVYNDESAAGNEKLEGAEKEQSAAYNSGTLMEGVEEFSDEQVRQFHRLLPDVIRSDGGIDVYAFANRAQRMANESRESLLASMNTAAEESNSVQELRQNLDTYLDEEVKGKMAKWPNVDDDTEPGFRSYMESWKRTKASKPPEGENSGRDSAEDNQSWWEDFVDFSSASMEDGGQFATFRVNHVATMDESFSNQTGESGISSTLNGTSADIREKKFNFAGGNIMGGPLGDLVTGATSAAKDVVAGSLSSVGLDGLMAFAGEAFTEIPLIWQSSEVQLPKATYEMNLRSPYGNKMARLLNLYVPLSMIMAAALPKSTGRHSYDSPFLVELYDRGRAQVRLGMIDSLSISRGAGNIGWDQDNNPLAIDVSFSVVDLSPIMHMPINTSPGIFDEDSAFSDYMATLGGLSLADQIYQSRKLQMNLTKFTSELRSTFSASRWGMWPAGVPSRVLSRLTRFAG